MLAVPAGAAISPPDPPPFSIVWNTPSKDASESMPAGGFDTGLNVWVENGELLIYVQRSGCLAEDNEYLKLGRLRVKLTPNPFLGGPFRQELVLREGRIQINGELESDGRKKPVTVHVWAETDRPVVHIEIAAGREIAVLASYENWRGSDELVPNADRRRSAFTLDQYPGKVVRGKDTVTHRDAAVFFYHRNPAKGLLPGLLLRQQGLEKYRDQIHDDLSNRTFGGLFGGTGFRAAGTGMGKYQATPYKAWRLVSEKPARRHHLRLVSHIAQTPTLEAWEQGLQTLWNESQDDVEAARERARAWWAQFWNRSWIVINPDHPDPGSKPWRAARNAALFRFQLGCNAFGEYPTKFNGGNLVFDPCLVTKNRLYSADWRNWGGGVFTAQNQRLVYWPMLKSGDFDAILSQFELYRKGLPGARARVREHFGHDGAVFCEYTSAFGVAMGNGWGWKTGRRGRGEEIPLGDPRADAAKGYNAVVEKGIMANGSIAYHWESQLESAYMMLEYRRFTGRDIRKYIPFIENSLVFFDEHYRLRERLRSAGERELDGRGKLVIFPSTSCESYRGAKNPADLIAGLRACLEGILELDEAALQLRDKQYYRAFLERVPEYTFAAVNGDRILQPAESWKRYQNVECPQFYPLFPFNRFDLLGRDHELRSTFRNTWKHGTFPKHMVISWHQDGIFFARMAMTQEAAAYNLRKLDDSPRRFPTFWGPGHDWVPDHNWGGSGMIGLQEMLLQTPGRTIHVLPAWPKDWDVDFKLKAPYRTTVTGRVRNGKLVELTVTPESRRKDLIVGEGW